MVLLSIKDQARLEWACEISEVNSPFRYTSVYQHLVQGTRNSAGDTCISLGDTCISLRPSVRGHRRVKNKTNARSHVMEAGCGLALSLSLLNLTLSRNDKIWTTVRNSDEITTRLQRLLVENLVQISLPRSILDKILCEYRDARFQRRSGCSTTEQEVHEILDRKSLESRRDLDWISCCRPYLVVISTKSRTVVQLSPFWLSFKCRRDLGRIRLP